MKITKGGERRIIPAGSVSVSDTGGVFGGDTSLQEILEDLAGGVLGDFLTVVGGGKGTIQSLGSLGTTETLNLNSANYFAGTLNADCTINFTGWTSNKDCQITLELTEDGTGGWSPTFTGVTWIGGSTPTHDTTAGSVSLYVFLSRDGGTLIYGALLGSGSGGGFLEAINGGGGTVQAHGNLGTTETINTASGNYHWGTLNANCTFTFTTVADTAERWFTLELIEDGTGGWSPTWPGSVVWLGGSAPAHTTTAGTTTIYVFFTRNGGTTWIGGQLGGGTTSPLTTKGDLYTYSTTNARLTVAASSNSILRPDSSQATGLVWDSNYNFISVAPRWELVMQDGVTSPPEPLENEAGDDWIYQLVT